MTKPRNIFLIGPMGAGKSTVGKCLAKELEFDFYDSDKEIEKHAGASVDWIFEIEGEAGFRKREEQVIDALANLNNIVLATGGGAILSERNRTILSDRGFVVYLQVSLKTQLARIEHAHGRPLLKDANMSEKLRKLQQEREALYQSLANWIVNTDAFTPTTIAQSILKEFQR